MGGFTKEGIDYFVRRAEGGFGLLFSGGTNGDCQVDGCDGILNHPEEFIRQGKELNERIATFGCKMFIQLSMNVGRNGGLKTPSPLPTFANPDVITEELTVKEIHTKIEEMGRVGCAVNPEVGYEGSRDIRKADTPKKVVIVGGGVAGMEAARLLKLRGHSVKLYEKSDVLGDNLIPAGAHDFKVEIGDLTNYYINQMKKLNVDIRMNTEVNADMLKESDADAIILATGSVPVMPGSIEGIDKAVSGVDALLNRKPIGENVVIVGGGLVGCEIAYGYAKKGKQVTIIEALPEILNLNNVPGMNKAMLLDAFEFYDTKIYTETKLKSVMDDGAVVELADGSEKKLTADTVILSIGYRPLPSMKESLKDSGIPIYEIGDGNKVGNVMTCIAEAYETAINL